MDLLGVGSGRIKVLGRGGLSELVFLAVSLLLRLRLSIHWGVIGSSNELLGDSKDPQRIERRSY